jgi:hypothetical protein
MGSEQTKGEQSVNFKLVLKAYSTLRQLTDDESALLATLRGMSEPEREALVVAMQPERTTGKKKATKKTGGKSPRASAMAATLGKNLAVQRQDVKCGHVFDNSETCFARPGNAIHDPQGGYSSYHEFVAPSAQAASAGD